MRSSTFLYLQASAAAASSFFTPPASLSKRADSCDCYLTNGTAPEYYTSHRLFDFRSLSKYVSVPDVANSFSDNAKAPFANPYFESDDWKASWRIQHWNNSESVKKSATTKDPKLLMTNSFGNVYIEKNQDKDASSETYMTMRTKRLDEFQSAAEIESAEQYHFLSVRMLARTVGSPGAITALFTYRDGGSLAKVQEADIEILTRGPRNHISYTNQPSRTDGGDLIPQASRNATLPGGKEWSEWLVHRLDWTPRASIWYVDGEEVARNEFQTPRDPSQVILNAWSNGGVWSGKMGVNDEAYMQIQWIDMVFNKTGESAKKRGENGSCGVVCAVDDEAAQAQDLIQQDPVPAMSSRTELSWVVSAATLLGITASLLGCL
ncbi:hypothetical protein NLU13_2762 [Sarocladium strictum]|uniref:GH16 domain-containing protein n=1 Tax=Sarocladium strictum TaxID=5046 RepID=A0AA39GNF1_SARSR|nr:hypothetical protein NLU13_2762 [Sarocladium strictum]